MMQQPVRSLVLWFPDWPVTALLREHARPKAGAAAVQTAGEGVPVHADGSGAERTAAMRSLAPPIALVANNVIVACSPAARAEGVRRGQRRRDAQARCPQLRVVAADPARDHRVFAPVVSVIEDRVPGVQILRPGVCALHARGAARYYGGEAAAAQELIDALAAHGIEGVRAGVGDGPFTAEQAARRGAPLAPGSQIAIVPAGASAEFLAPLPAAVLTETGFAAAHELVELLDRLGVRSLGAFARLDAERVRDRFGAQGVRLHDLAAGHDSRAVEARVPPPELHREMAFEPPLEIVEQLAFGMRMAADAFIARLGAAQLVCTELRVELTAERGERSERVWLHPASFDAAAVVDRVRWQLSEAQGQGTLRSGIAHVRIEPAAVADASTQRPAIFGGGPEEKVHHALSRVQAMLGHRGVLTPAIGGGRWLAERQVLVPWGDRTVLAKDRGRPWPGTLPDPLPATVFPEPYEVEVLGQGGGAVAVDERGALTARPAVLVESGRRLGVDAWAGPWPVIERGWDALRSRHAYRFQVVDAEHVAWLFIWEADEWRAEARYD